MDASRLQVAARRGRDDEQSERTLGKLDDRTLPEVSGPAGEVSSLRDSWERGSAILDLQKEQVAALIEPAFPGQTLTYCKIAEGGLSNTNLFVRLSGRPDPVLLRVYTRDPSQASKEWAILTRLSGQIPVPRLFYSAMQSDEFPHAYAIMEWVEGMRAELASPDKIGHDGLREVAHSIGRTLAGIHSVHFDVAGFLDGNLAVVERISLGGDALTEFLDEQLGASGPGRQNLGSKLADSVINFAAQEGGLLNTWSGAPSLTHADYGGSNILVRNIAAGWRTSAILDWEFSFSGTPFFDLGNLLRPPLGTLDGFEQAVAQGYREAGGLLPPEWRRISLLTDLYSWAEFLGRPSCGPNLAEAARKMIMQTMRSFTARQ